MHKILLLEDDKTLNRGIALTLRKAGYEVVPAETLSEAEEFFSKERFALIISDITLPDGSGLEFGHRVRKEGNTYLMYLTALDSEIDIVTGYDTGTEDLIMQRKWSSGSVAF